MVSIFSISFRIYKHAHNYIRNFIGKVLVLDSEQIEGAIGSTTMFAFF